ncbi:MORN repeat variant [Planctomycetes bacterium Poly30]|uniref:MORN repeat variant n=2 Tax=Saltatorellus ferox TaxID=2528018 RepID=A0A518ERV6_9BACT|nr:MORN repeat variant [Planctomycetes bacterium Poly30]
MTGCGPSHEEGEIRTLRKEGRAGLVSVEGRERFVDGEWQKHGEFVFFDDGGEEIARGFYENGLEQGDWTQSYEDGCRGVGAFEKGQRSGPWQTFHRNGKLQDQGVYEDGLRTGTWVSYRDDGTKLREAEYSAGKLNGRVTYFKKDGRTIEPARSGVYEDGEQIQGR